MDTYRSQMLDDQPETDDNSLHDEQLVFEADTHTVPSKQPDKQPKRAFIEKLRNYNNGMSSLSKQKQRLVRRGVIVSGVIIVLLLFAMTYKYWAIQRNVTAFQVGTAQQAPQNVGGGGIVYPLQQVNVAFPAPERAMNVLVKAGDQVKIGQPLIKLDPALLNAQINQASASLSAAQAYLNSVSGAFPYSGVAVAAAQHALAIAQSRYNTLSSQNASQTMRNGDLISPVKGIIAAVNVNAGETIAANAVLITLMDQSSVIVRAKIPLANLNQIHSGMPATVTPSALPNETLNGTVSSIVPQADPQTDTFGVWVQVANPQQDILPGMSAFVQLKTQVGAYVVPRLAVLNPDRESSIFEIRNNHAYMAPVHVIGRTENSVYIDQGLRPGEIIVLLPLNKILKEGQQVNVTGTEH